TMRRWFVLRLQVIRRRSFCISLSRGCAASLVSLYSSDTASNRRSPPVACCIRRLAVTISHCGATCLRAIRFLARCCTVSERHFHYVVEEGSAVGEVTAVDRYLVRGRGLSGIYPNALVMFADGSKGIVREVAEEHVSIMHLGATELTVGA